jgi:hypothetical protein
MIESNDAKNVAQQVKTQFNGVDKAKELVSQYEEAQKKFSEALDKLTPEQSIDAEQHFEALTQSDSALASARTAHKNFLDDKGAKKTGINEDEFNKAKEALSKAEEAYKEQRGKVSKFFGEHANNDVKSAFKAAEKHVTAMEKLPNAWFGKFKTEGAFGALKHNFGIAEGSAVDRKGAIFGRVSGTALGAVMIGDAVMRNKSGNDNQPRGWVSRLAEGAAGAGLLAYSAVGGKARL